MNDIDIKDIERLTTLTENADKISVSVHMRPDGDAIGSCTALFHCLKEDGKDPFIILPDKSPDYLSFLTSGIPQDRIAVHEDNPESTERIIYGSDLIFCLDYNAFHRTGKMGDALSASKARKVLIDHHLNPERELFDLVFSETEISSTAEYLFHILMKMPAYASDASRLPGPAALALMTGMTTDTNNFANSVHPSTLRMASSLLEAGVDREMILEHLYQEYREERIRLQGELLSRNLTVSSEGVAIITLDRSTIGKYNLQEGETEGFVNIPLGIGKVKISCFLKEDGDRIRVSLRSKKGISANRCAAMYFHGGGHEQAAGGKLTIPEDLRSFDEAAGYASRAIHEFMNSKTE